MRRCGKSIDVGCLVEPLGSWMKVRKLDSRKGGMIDLQMRYIQMYAQTPAPDAFIYPIAMSSAHHEPTNSPQYVPLQSIAHWAQT